MAARSNYFRALMFGGLQETHQNEIEIVDANVTAFNLLLKYIYKGFVSLKCETEDTVYDLLGLGRLL